MKKTLDHFVAMLAQAAALANSHPDVFQDLPKTTQITALMKLAARFRYKLFTA